MYTYTHSSGFRVRPVKSPPIKAPFEDLRTTVQYLRKTGVKITVRPQQPREGSASVNKGNEEVGSSSKGKEKTNLSSNDNSTPIRTLNRGEVSQQMRREREKLEKEKENEKKKEKEKDKEEDAAITSRRIIAQRSRREKEKMAKLINAQRQGSEFEKNGLNVQEASMTLATSCTKDIHPETLDRLKQSNGNGAAVTAGEMHVGCDAFLDGQIKGAQPALVPQDLIVGGMCFPGDSSRNQMEAVKPALYSEPSDVPSESAFEIRGRLGNGNGSEKEDTYKDKAKNKGTEKDVPSNATVLTKRAISQRLRREREKAKELADFVKESSPTLASSCTKGIHLGTLGRLKQLNDNETAVTAGGVQVRCDAFQDDQMKRAQPALVPEDLIVDGMHFHGDSSRIQMEAVRSALEPSDVPPGSAFELRGRLGHGNGSEESTYKDKAKKKGTEKDVPSNAAVMTKRAIGQRLRREREKAKELADYVQESSRTLPSSCTKGIHLGSLDRLKQLNGNGTAVTAGGMHAGCDAFQDGQMKGSQPALVPQDLIVDGMRSHGDSSQNQMEAVRPALEPSDVPPGSVFEIRGRLGNGSDEDDVDKAKEKETEKGVPSEATTITKRTIAQRLRRERERMNAKLGTAQRQESEMEKNGLNDQERSRTSASSYTKDVHLGTLDRLNQLNGNGTAVTANEMHVRCDAFQNDQMKGAQPALIPQDLMVGGMSFHNVLSRNQMEAVRPALEPSDGPSESASKIKWGLGNGNGNEKKEKGVPSDVTVMTKRTIAQQLRRERERMTAKLGTARRQEGEKEKTGLNTQEVRTLASSSTRHILLETLDSLKQPNDNGTTATAGGMHNSSDAFQNNQMKGAQPALVPQDLIVDRVHFHGDSFRNQMEVVKPALKPSDVPSESALEIIYSKEKKEKEQEKEEGVPSDLTITSKYVIGQRLRREREKQAKLATAQRQKSLMEKNGLNVREATRTLATSCIKDVHPETLDRLKQLNSSGTAATAGRMYVSCDAFQNDQMKGVHPATLPPDLLVGEISICNDSFRNQMEAVKPASEPFDVHLRSVSETEWRLERGIGNEKEKEKEKAKEKDVPSDLSIMSKSIIAQRLRRAREKMAKLANAQGQESEIVKNGLNVQEASRTLASSCTKDIHPEPLDRLKQLNGKDTAVTAGVMHVCSNAFRNDRMKAAQPTSIPQCLAVGGTRIHTDSFCNQVDAVKPALEPQTLQCPVMEELLSSSQPKTSAESHQESERSEGIALKSEVKSSNVPGLVPNKVTSANRQRREKERVRKGLVFRKASRTLSSSSTKDIRLETCNRVKHPGDGNGMHSHSSSSQKDQMGNEKHLPVYDNYVSMCSKGLPLHQERERTEAAKRKEREEDPYSEVNNICTPAKQSRQTTEQLNAKLAFSQRQQKEMEKNGLNTREASSSSALPCTKDIQPQSFDRLKHHTSDDIPLTVDRMQNATDAFQVDLVERRQRSIGLSVQDASRASISSTKDTHPETLDPVEQHDGDGAPMEVDGVQFHCSSLEVEKMAEKQPGYMHPETLDPVEHHDGNGAPMAADGLFCTSHQVEQISEKQPAYMYPEILDPVDHHDDGAPMAVDRVHIQCSLFPVEQMAKKQPAYMHSETLDPVEHHDGDGAQMAVDGVHIHCSSSEVGQMVEKQPILRPQGLQSPAAEEKVGSNLEAQASSKSWVLSSQCSCVEFDPDWALEEMLILVSQIASTDVDVLRSLPDSEKWQIVVDNCNALEVSKSVEQCRGKWGSLLADYRKIQDWETQPGYDSYWSMESERKMKFELPVFDEVLFNFVDGLVKAQVELVKEVEIVNVITDPGSKEQTHVNPQVESEKEVGNEIVLTNPSSKVQTHQEGSPRKKVNKRKEKMVVERSKKKFLQICEKIQILYQEGTGEKIRKR